MFLFAKEKQTHRHRDQTHGYQEGKGGGGEMNWQIGTDTHTLLILCIK